MAIHQLGLFAFMRLTARQLRMHALQHRCAPCLPANHLQEPVSRAKFCEET